MVSSLQPVPSDREEVVHHHAMHGTDKKRWACVRLAEGLTPVPDRFVGDGDAALGEEILWRLYLALTISCSGGQRQWG